MTRTVLVVDDVAAMRRALVELLESVDAFTVVGEAADGAEAVRKAEELRPELILMDIKMPELDGIQATAAIQERVPGATVVAYTAYEDAGLVREMIAAGAKGYVLKGSDSDDVIDALQAAVNGQGVVSRSVTRPLLDDLQRLYEEERQRAASLAGLVDHLQEVATTDYQTGLHNHRYFQERLEEEVARAERQRETIGLIVLDLDDFKLVNDHHGHARGDELLQQVASAIRSALPAEAQPFRIGGDEFAVVLPATDPERAQALAAKLHETIRDARFADFEPQTASVGLAMYPLHAAEKGELIQVADVAMYHSKEGTKNCVTTYDAALEAPSRVAWRVREREEYMNAVLAVAAAIDARSETVYVHCQNASRIAVALAQELDLPATQVEVVRIGALLHDTGKIGVPDGILRKPGALEEHEWELMKEHTEKGRAILGHGIPKPVVDCVVYHHEQPDGKGYPHGLKGDQIPFSARIVRVADVFDSLTSNQPFRKALTEQDALAHLVNGRGSKFDADAVDALVRIIGRGLLREAA